MIYLEDKFKSVGLAIIDHEEFLDKQYDVMLSFINRDFTTRVSTTDATKNLGLPETSMFKVAMSIEVWETHINFENYILTWIEE